MTSNISYFKDDLQFPQLKSSRQVSSYRHRPMTSKTRQINHLLLVQSHSTVGEFSYSQSAKKGKTKLYEQAIEMKSIVNFLTKEIALAKSHIHKKDAELIKKEKAIEEAMHESQINSGFALDKLKDTENLSRLRNYFRSIKEELNVARQVNDDFKKAIKYSKVNEYKKEVEEQRSVLLGLVESYQLCLEENHLGEERLNQCRMNAEIFKEQHQTINAYEKDVNDVKGRTRRLMDEIAKLKDSISLNDNRIKKKRIEHNNLKSQRDKLLIEKKNRENYKLQKPLLEKKIAEIEEQISEYKGKIASNDSKIKELQEYNNGIQAREEKKSNQLKPFDYASFIKGQSDVKAGTDPRISLLLSLINESQKNVEKSKELILQYEEYINQSEEEKKSKKDPSVIEEKRDEDESHLLEEADKEKEKVVNVDEINQIDDEESKDGKIISESKLESHRSKSSSQSHSQGHNSNKKSNSKTSKDMEENESDYHSSQEVNKSIKSQRNDERLSHKENTKEERPDDKENINKSIDSEGEKLEKNDESPSHKENTNEERPEDKEINNKSIFKQSSKTASQKSQSNSKSSDKSDEVNNYKDHETSSEKEDKAASKSDSHLKEKKSISDKSDANSKRSLIKKAEDKQEILEMKSEGKEEEYHFQDPFAQEGKENDAVIKQIGQEEAMKKSHSIPEPIMMINHNEVEMKKKESFKENEANKAESIIDENRDDKKEKDASSQSKEKDKNKDKSRDKEDIVDVENNKEIFEEKKEDCLLQEQGNKEDIKDNELKDYNHIKDKSNSSSSSAKDKLSKSKSSRSKSQNRNSNDSQNKHNSNHLFIKENAELSIPSHESQSHDKESHHSKEDDNKEQNANKKDNSIENENPLSNEKETKPKEEKEERAKEETISPQQPLALSILNIPSENEHLEAQVEFPKPSEEEKALKEDLKCISPNLNPLKEDNTSFQIKSEMMTPNEVKVNFNEEVAKLQTPQQEAKIDKEKILIERSDSLSKSHMEVTKINKDLNIIPLPIKKSKEIQELQLNDQIRNNEEIFPIIERNDEESEYNSRSRREKEAIHFKKSKSESLDNKQNNQISLKTSKSLHKDNDEALASNQPQLNLHQFKYLHSEPPKESNYPFRKIDLYVKAMPTEVRFKPKKGKYSSLKMILLMIFSINYIPSFTFPKYNPDASSPSDYIVIISTELLNLINSNNPDNLSLMVSFLSFIYESECNCSIDDLIVYITDLLSDIPQYTKDYQIGMIARLRLDYTSDQISYISNKLSSEYEAYIDYKAFKLLLKEAHIPLNDQFDYLIYKMKAFTDPSQSLYSLSIANLFSLLNYSSQIIPLKEEETQRSNDSSIRLSDEEFNKIIFDFLMLLKNQLNFHRTTLRQLVAECTHSQVHSIAGKVTTVDMSFLLESLPQIQISIEDDITKSCVYAKYQFSAETEHIVLDFIEKDIQLLK